MKAPKRMFVTSLLAAMTAISASPVHASEHKLLTTQDIKWGLAPSSIPAGAQVAVLYGDPSKDGLFDRARGRIVGSEHYLTKPFTKDELLNAIETHVGQAAR